MAVVVVVVVVVSVAGLGSAWETETAEITFALLAGRPSRYSQFIRDTCLNITSSVRFFVPMSAGLVSPGSLSNL